MDIPIQDPVSLRQRFAAGSIGAVHYYANGSKSFPKECFDIFPAGRVLELDNFRKLKGFGWQRFRKINLWLQDKGQKACAKSFIEAVKGRGPVPIPIEEIIEISRISIELARAAK